MKRLFTFIAALSLLVLACNLGAPPTTVLEAEPTQKHAQPSEQQGSCGDGVCDAAEQADPNLCPADCSVPETEQPADSVPAAVSEPGVEPTTSTLVPPQLTHEQSITVGTGSIWSIPVYDGSNLVLSTEVIGSSGGIYLSKYDLSLILVGTATHIVSPSDINNNIALTYTHANNITSIADHKHIFQDGYHYITFSTSGTGNGGNLYLMKIDTDLVLQSIVEVTTNNAPTNDMFMVGDGSKVHVGKFHPGQGHDIYTFDADLNSEDSATPIGCASPLDQRPLPRAVALHRLTGRIARVVGTCGNTGVGNATNQHANGAAAIFHNNQFHIVAPETLAPGQGDYFYHIVFDIDWDVVEERTIILADPTMLGIVSGLSHEPNTDTFIVHYTRGDTDGGGYIYQAIYDSNWTLLANEVLISSGNYQRPHSLFVDNELFLGYDSAGVYLSKFHVTYP